MNRNELINTQTRMNTQELIAIAAGMIPGINVDGGAKDMAGLRKDNNMSIQPTEASAN